MRSRFIPHLRLRIHPRVQRRLVVCMVSLCAAWLPVGATAQTAAPAIAPTRQQVMEGLTAVRANPDLPGTHKQKTLRFKDQDKAPERDTAPAPEWWKGFALWVSDTGRVLAWVLGALLLAFVVIKLRHWINVRAGGSTLRSVKNLPSHVRDLDIRPESLPDRIGAAARALWERGEHRPALSLLYRGALSRLVHEHALPVRAASTEGECLVLAAQRLPVGPSAFFARLVQAWQLAVYGARLPESAQVLSLCDEFDLHLAPPPAARQEGVP